MANSGAGAGAAAGARRGCSRFRSPGGRQSRSLPGGAQQSAAGSGFYGTLTLPAKAAPPIDLRNYLGQPVRSSSYRGKAVLVTFLYANCPDICPLITSNLRVALNMLGREDSHVQVIAVSVDPRGDTPANVARFLRAHGMLGQDAVPDRVGAPNARGPGVPWGVGSTREVGQPNLVSHSALVYGISASGRLMTALSGDVRTERDRPRRAAARQAATPQLM